MRYRRTDQTSRFTLLIAVAVGVTAVGAVQPPAGQQAVLETSLGSIVIELFPASAPKHVEAFRKRLTAGFYHGTTFHRAIPLGIIQGGDPLTREAANFDRFGTGGLSELQAEFNERSHTRGAVSAVLIPGNRDSAGSQFFICVTDQLQLDGQYTVFGRVVEGMEVVERISQLQTDEFQRIRERVEIRRTYQRDPPPPEVLPFQDASIGEMARYRASLETSMGPIELDFFPDSAPEHVRRFLALSKLGLYDGTRFHRIVPGFVLQGGSLGFRSEPVPEKYQALITPLKGEFSKRKHVRGTLSMARSDDPDSALDSFFIVLDDAQGLDEQYTVFGQVMDGWSTIEAMEFVSLAGEAPVRPILIESVTLRTVR